MQFQESSNISTCEQYEIASMGCFYILSLTIIVSNEEAIKLGEIWKNMGKVGKDNEGEILQLEYPYMKFINN